MNERNAWGKIGLMLAGAAAYLTVLDLVTGQLGWAVVDGIITFTLYKMATAGEGKTEQ